MRFEIKKEGKKIYGLGETKTPTPKTCQDCGLIDPSVQPVGVDDEQVKNLCMDCIDLLIF